MNTSKIGTLLRYVIYINDTVQNISYVLLVEKYGKHFIIGNVATRWLLGKIRIAICLFNTIKRKNQKQESF